MNTKIFSYPITIKENHLDSFGHVNNATYLDLYEQARWELVTNNGYGLEKIHQSGLGPTILEVNIRFLRELRLREEIIITTQLMSYKKKISKLQQKMLRGDELCSQAEFTIALFDLKQRKLVLPTQEWLQAIGVRS